MSFPKMVVRNTMLKFSSDCWRYTVLPSVTPYGNQNSLLHLHYSVFQLHRRWQHSPHKQKNTDSDTQVKDVGSDRKLYQTNCLINEVTYLGKVRKESIIFIIMTGLRSSFVISYFQFHDNS